MKITNTVVIAVIVCLVVIPLLLLSIARFAHIQAFCTPVTTITIVDDDFTLEEAQLLASKYLPDAEVRQTKEHHYEAFTVDGFLILKQGTEAKTERGRICE